MKKLSKILIASAVLLCGLVITGCAAAETVKEIVYETHNRWYKYKSDKQIDIPVLAALEEDGDNASESATKLENAEIYFYFDTNDGLLVAVQSTTTQTVEMLKGLYSQDMTVVMGATKRFTKEQFGSGKWTALTMAVKLQAASEPEISAHPEKCIVLGGDENKPKIQWKKFLANYLLGNYLED